MPSPDEDKANELLAKVRKEPANKLCANCNNTSRLGFGAVCTKYNTFGTLIPSAAYSPNAFYWASWPATCSMPFFL